MIIWQLFWDVCDRDKVGKHCYLLKKREKTWQDQWGCGWQFSSPLFNVRKNFQPIETGRNVKGWIHLAPWHLQQQCRPIMLSPSSSLPTSLCLLEPHVEPIFYCCSFFHLKFDHVVYTEAFQKLSTEQWSEWLQSLLAPTSLSIDLWPLPSTHSCSSQDFVVGHQQLEEHSNQWSSCSELLWSQSLLFSCLKWTWTEFGLCIALRHMMDCWIIAQISRCTEVIDCSVSQWMNVVKS